MAQPILSVEALNVSFDGFIVLDDLNLKLDYQELRFLIGPNGAGKTTLLDVITGKTRASRGKVVFNGKIDLARRQEHDLVRLGIGRKFQTPSVFTSLTVYENLEVAAGFRSRVDALFRPLSQQQTGRIEQALEQIGLTERAHHLAGVLSHGEKQWLEIGMLMTQDPQLLLLDEPVAGMTRRERERTGELLEAISQDRTVLVVEHDMEFVRQFARKVTVLHLGNILSEGSMDTVQRDQKVIKAYLGRSGVLGGSGADRPNETAMVGKPWAAPARAQAV
jgi:urea transport system ATP-binding protein